LGKGRAVGFDRPIFALPLRLLLRFVFRLGPGGREDPEVCGLGRLDLDIVLFGGEAGLDRGDLLDRAGRVELVLDLAQRCRAGLQRLQVLRGDRFYLGCRIGGGVQPPRLEIRPLG
jgi:hypothetical protein